MPARKRPPFVALAIAVLATGVLVFVGLEPGWRPGANSVPTDVAGVAALPAPPGARPPSLSAPRPAQAREGDRDRRWTPPTGVRDPNWGQHDPVLDDVLEAYLASAVYPPDSRPLGVQNDDLLNPNKRYEEPVASADGEVEIRFSADRFFVTGEEPLTSFLEVRRAGALVPVEITASFAAVLVPGKPLAELGRIPLEFVPRDGLYINVFAPGRRPDLTASVEMGVYIELDYGGETRPRASFVVHVTPATTVPARFTGAFRDYLGDGSLVIEAELDVREAGYYLIDANLYDEEGYPVAWTRFKGNLETGRRQVPLSFFGKVLVDSRATPPFHLGQLRGKRFVEGRDPDMDLVPPYDGEYVTRRYSLDEFSDAEWDGPEKRKQIQLLSEHRRPL